MADCDICGKPAVMQAIVEGARLSVCQLCAGYGKQLRGPSRPRPAMHAPLKELAVVEGYSRIVSQAREAAGLTRAELARKLLIFENVVERIEEGKLKPSEDVARKLETALKITIIEEAKKEEAPAANPRPAEFSHGHRRAPRELTLADIVTIKKK